MYFSVPIKAFFILFILFLSSLLLFSFQSPDYFISQSPLGQLGKLYADDTFVYGRVDRIVDEEWLVILLEDEDEEVILRKESQLRVSEQDLLILIKDSFDYQVFKVAASEKEKKSLKSISFFKKKD